MLETCPWSSVSQDVFEPTINLSKSRSNSTSLFFCWSRLDLGLQEVAAIRFNPARPHLCVLSQFSSECLYCILDEYESGLYAAGMFRWSNEWFVIGAGSIEDMSILVSGPDSDVQPRVSVWHIELDMLSVFVVSANVFLKSSGEHDRDDSFFSLVVSLIVCGNLGLPCVSKSFWHSDSSAWTPTARKFWSDLTGDAVWKQRCVGLIERDFLTDFAGVSAVLPTATGEHDRDRFCFAIAVWLRVWFNFIF